MLSLIPTILFLIQSLFLYLERDLLDIDNNCFWIVSKIISLNVIIIFSTYFLPKNKRYQFKLSKINEKLNSKKNSLIILCIYILLFFIQVFIRKSIPALTGYVIGEAIYNEWAVSPFSGFMTILFLLILGERVSKWINLKSSKDNEINNAILIIMIFISLLMLRRDIFGLLLFGLSIKFYVLFTKSLNQIISKLKISKFFIGEFRTIVLIFIGFIFIFTIVGGLRGAGTGLARDYWQILSLYLATPLSNSFSLIRFEESGNLSVADFLIGGSSLGRSLLNLIGIKTGFLPNENFIMPNFNVVSSLGYFYQVFGQNFYIIAIGLYSGILSILEINWKEKEPILFSIILILSSASIFYHYFGSITFTLVFPLIYLINKYRIRLL